MSLYCEFLNRFKQLKKIFTFLPTMCTHCTYRNLEINDIA